MTVSHALQKASVAVASELHTHAPDCCCLCETDQSRCIDLSRMLINDCLKVRQFVPCFADPNNF
jgi:hypothetical protein